MSCPIGCSRFDLNVTSCEGGFVFRYILNFILLVNYLCERIYVGGITDELSFPNSFDANCQIEKAEKFFYTMQKKI